MSTMFYERVDKWIHEPRSTFKYKKHLLLAFTILYIFSNYKQKYKKTFTFCKHKQKPKKNFTLLFLLS